MSTPPQRVGIVGFGQRASLWQYAHRPDDATRPSAVVAVCDPSPRGRDRARAALPDALLTADLDEFLAHDLDAVLVLTPDFAHYPVALRTLEAGIATFCEKPLGITVAECDEMLETARRTGTRLYVGHNMRHMPVIVAMREAILAGAIGEVKAVWCRHFVSTGGDYYFKDWHAERSKSTSLLLQKGAHDIDVMHWLAGGYSTRVAAMGDLAVYGDIESRRDNSDRYMREWYSRDTWPPTTQHDLNPVIDVEDISMMTMTLDNGVLASYQQCHFTPDYWRNYTVIGTAGRLENLGDRPGDTIHVWNTRSDNFGEPDQVITIADAEGSHGGADPLLIAEFLRFAREGGRTQTSPVAARQAVAAGCVAADSLRSDGGAREVPALDPGLVAYFENFQACG
ncbi:Gfo/Idh/MocA family oxidoreductase [Micrococcales bacterium 31B]|nr:Gfo/Idh/MocA family oxidoreductase [Micrococcales bacterium 31B]